MASTLSIEVLHGPGKAKSKANWIGPRNSLTRDTVLQSLRFFKKAFKGVTIKNILQLRIPLAAFDRGTPLVSTAACAILVFIS